MQRRTVTIAAAAALALTAAATPAQATFTGRNGPLLFPFSDNTGQDTRVENLPYRMGMLTVPRPGGKVEPQGWCSSPTYPPPCEPIVTMSFAPGGRLVAGVGETRGGVVVANRDGTGRRTLLPHGSSASWSPDGRSLAVIDAGDLFTLRGDGSDQRRLTRWNVSYGSIPAGSGAASPAWSPDGRIAFVHARSTRAASPATDVLSIDPATRGVKTLARVRDADSLDWSPDGRRLLFVSGARVHTVDPRGRSHKRLRLPALAATWSPDGRFIAAIDKTSVTREPPTYVVARADGSHRRRYSLAESVTGFDPSDEERGVGGPVWSPAP
jgi:Tol biopolymer transport system component